MQIDILIGGSDQQQINVQYTNKIETFYTQKTLFRIPFSKWKKRRRIVVEEKKSNEEFSNLVNSAMCMNV